MNVLAAVPYLVVLIVALAAATFAFPQTDDFCTFGRLRDVSGLNPFGETLNLYTAWTGRFSASFFTALVGWFGFVLPLPVQWTYAGGLMLAIALILPAAYSATSAVVRDGSVTQGAIIVACLLAIMPWKIEGALWLTGVMVYTFGTSFFFAIVGQLQRSSNRVSPTAVFLLVLAPAFNEFLSLVIGTFLIAWTGTDARDHRLRNVAYLAIFSLAFIVALAAPGNFARDQATARPHDLSYALSAGWASLVAMFQVDIGRNALVWGGLVPAAIFAGWGRQPTHWRKMVPFILATAAVLPIHLVAYPYLLNEPMAGRVLNQCLGLFSAGVLFVAFWLGAVLSQKVRLTDVVARGAVLALGAAFIFSAPVQEFVGAVRDYGPIWKADQNARYAQLQDLGESQGVQTVAAFTPEGTWPPLLHGTDITEDPEYWVNRCVASFFEIDAIKLASG